MNEKAKQIAKLVLLEFVIILAAEIGWNFFRKTGQSLIDSIAIALLTAIGLVIFIHKRQQARTAHRS